MKLTIANLKECDEFQSDRCLDAQVPICCDVLVEETGLSTGPRPPIVVHSPARSVLNSRCAIVGMLAFVGPLGLPFLWFSQRFTRSTKVAITAVFLVLTVVLPLAFTYYWVETAIRPLLEAFRGVRH
jgi:hypothetical protein